VTHGLEPVADRRRTLELLRLGGPAHLLLQLALEPPVPPRQEGDDLVDQAAVLVA
jgi:hypothetical protein